MHIFHKWSKWSDPISTYCSAGKQQWRVCTKCNKADFKTLRWDKQSRLKDVLTATKQVQEGCDE